MMIGSSTMESSLLVILLCLLFLSPLLTEVHAEQPELASRVIPCPKEIRLNGNASVPANRVFLMIPEMDSPLLDTARELLAPYNTGNTGFEIQLILTSQQNPPCSSAVLESLRTVPNSDQAYAIEPRQRDGRFDGLLLVANTPLGLLYAARTLMQILPERPENSVLIPSLSLLDWPDLSERGQWGGNSVKDISWLSERKMNVIEVFAKLGFDDQGAPTATLDQNTLSQAGTFGVKIVPIILHLEQLEGTGIFDHYPELAGKHDPNRPLPTDYKPGLCLAKPETTAILSEWMRQLLAYPEIHEIMVWLSENAAPCYCPDCSGKEPYTREVECVQNAFQKAKQTKPNAALRILTTQGSHPVNDKIIQALDPETKLSYYDGSRTYDSSHKPMISPLFEEFAASGRWLGVYPQLTNSWRTVFPFTGPQFIHARMKEFADKKLQCLIGYATPSNRYYEFNVTAAAEWSWNSKGRTPTEFAKVYGQRKGIANSERFAEWAQIIGSVGWDIAGSRVLSSLIHNPAGVLAPKDGAKTENPLDAVPSLVFGEGILAEFPTLDHFEEDIVLSERALQLAKAENNAEMIEESLCVLGTLHFIEGLTQISGAKNLPEDQSLQNFALGTAKVQESARSVTAALYRWGHLVNPAPRDALPSRYRDTVNVFSKTAAYAMQLATGVGIEDSSPDYRPRQVLEWKTEDFSQSPQITLWADVSDYLESEGEYDVTFEFNQGAVGLEVNSVAFLTGTSQQDATVFDEIRLTFRVGKSNTWTEYWMRVPKEALQARQEQQRFFLRCEVKGPALELPPSRRTTRGHILIRKSWRDSGR